MTTTEVLLSHVDHLEIISLDELTALASLQTRTDRKYTVDISEVVKLFEALKPQMVVLRIDQHAAFSYHTLYFDTARFDSYLGSARRRPNRFKVRIRTYTDSGLRMLEVKCRDGRGATVKERMPYPDIDQITPEGAEFIDSITGIEGLAARLQPVLTTEFDRMTLFDPTDRSRITIDRHLTWRWGQQGAIRFEPRAIVETKSTGAASDVDRWLWQQGHRPKSFSKFCVGSALFNPSLPANKWNRILRSIGGWRPHRTTPGASSHTPHSLPTPGG